MSSHQTPKCSGWRRPTLRDGVLALRQLVVASALLLRWYLPIDNVVLLVIEPAVYDGHALHYQ